MYQETTTQELLLEQCRRYPSMQPTDLLKFLHQSTFGCGHLVDSPSAAADYIRWEMLRCRAVDESPIEVLDGEFCRVHLDHLKKLGLSEETFAKVFMLSAKESCGSVAELEMRIDTALHMAKHGLLPFSYAELLQAVDVWRKADYTACHHSDEFRKAYAPAYRVLKCQHAHWLPLLAAIDKQAAAKSRVLIAIDGGSASGKSTLSELLSQLYNCNVFHMDDFFLRPEQRTAERFAQPGGNIDYERFCDQVLLPLSRGESVQYRRFDCATFTLSPAVEISPKGLNIIEGAYSMHPELAGFYDFSLFLRVTPETQRARIKRRNTSETAQRFFDTWIPLEETYFTATNTAERCDMIWEVNA